MLYTKASVRGVDARREIAREKLIVIVRGLPPEHLAPLAEALYRGGVRLMEITFDQSRPESFAQTAAGVALLRDAFAGRIIPGAGTVMTQEQLALAHRAGAAYIVSPHTDAEIIRGAKERGLAAIPGATTPTEVVRAYALGADFIKIFPLQQLGPGYIRSLRAPLSHIPMLAVGNVTLETAGEYMRCGADGVCVGGQLVNRQWIEEKQWDKITACAAEMLRVVHQK